MDKEHNITENDIGRETRLMLLKDWGLVGFENGDELKRYHCHK